MKVLVCGGRRYNDWQHFNKILSKLNVEKDFHVVIHGGATGADWYAHVWAVNHGIREEAYPISQAEWRKHGGAAGPIRNQRMLDDGRPELVVAFPGGNGTTNMVNKAKAKGVEVIEVKG